jgi:hypothetical protein
MIGYVNGVALGSRKNFTALSLGTQQTLLGGVQNAGNTAQQLFYNGSIDQVRIFNRAITATEVSDLYAEPAASNNTLNYPAGAGCIAAYPLQTDAVDLSGNYNGASSNVTFGQPGYLTSNTNGTIPSTVAANQDAGFSIVKFTTPSSGNTTTGHGLNSTPELIIYKRTATTSNWIVYHSALGVNKFLFLNTAAAATTDTGVWSTPSLTTVPVNVGKNVSANSDYIAYCFHSVDGYQKVGSYTGDRPTDVSIYTGFAPRFVMIKCTVSGESWTIIDDARGDNLLHADTSGAEQPYTGVSLTSTGFTVHNSGLSNTNGATHIYLAIA